MHTYQIITDSACDLPQHLLKQLDVVTTKLHILYKGENLADSVDEGLAEIYAGLRAGEKTATTAVNPEGWKMAIEPVLQSGRDALVIAFSSGLSTTYQSAVIAAEELRESYPQQQIRVVDSLSAALGQGLLVWYACQQRDKGLDLDALAAWLEENKLHLCHWFTVNDLNHLKRGGRVSAATALVGTMLSIKPVLHVDDEGRLINVSKARGRKASLMAMVDNMEKTAIDPANQTVFISHGDCEEDAQIVADEIRKRFGTKDIRINYVGPVIGNHTGAGVVALFFLGTKR